MVGAANSLMVYEVSKLDNATITSSAFCLLPSLCEPSSLRALFLCQYGQRRATLPSAHHNFSVLRCQSKELPLSYCPVKFLEIVVAAH